MIFKVDVFFFVRVSEGNKTQVGGFAYLACSRNERQNGEKEEWNLKCRDILSWGGGKQAFKEEKIPTTQQQRLKVASGGNIVRSISHKYSGMPAKRILTCKFALTKASPLCWNPTHCKLDT